LFNNTYINHSGNHIEDRLVKQGAKNILKIYENEKLTGIAFIIDMGGKEMPFRLPARVERVEKRLREQVSRPRKETISRISDQASRTAWKLLSDWVDIQMRLIELDQVEFIEVFMPYLYDFNKKITLFEKMKSTGFSLLEDKR
jgi:hypothetical protein